MEKEKFLEEVAKVAYERYEQRGRHDGYAMDDWLEAERIVLNRHSAEVTREAEAIRAKGKAGTAKKSSSTAATKTTTAKKAATTASASAKKTAKKTVAKKK